MRRVALLVLACLLGTSHVEAELTLRDAFGGGDCEKAGAGIWNAADKTCTLQQDLSETFVIASGGLTLDGANHVLTGDPAMFPVRAGIQLARTDGSEVRNLILHGFRLPVHLDGGRNNRVIGLDVELPRLGRAEGILLEDTINAEIRSNTLRTRREAIQVVDGQGNTIAQNTLKGGSIVLSSTGENLVSRNVIEGASDAIFLWGASPNTLSENTLTNSERGILLRHTSTRNEILANTITIARTAGIEMLGRPRLNLIMFNVITHTCWSRK